MKSRFFSIVLLLSSVSLFGLNLDLEVKDSQNNQMDVSNLNIECKLSEEKTENDAQLVNIKIQRGEEVLANPTIAVKLNEPSEVQVGEVTLKATLTENNAEQPAPVKRSIIEDVEEKTEAIVENTVEAVTKKTIEAVEEAPAQAPQSEDIQAQSANDIEEKVEEKTEVNTNISSENN